MKILILNVAGIGDFFELIRWLYLLNKQHKEYIVDLVVSDRVYHYAKDCPYVNNVYFLKTKDTNVPLSVSNIFKLKKILTNSYCLVVNTFPSDSFLGDLKFLSLRLLNRKLKMLGAVRKKRLSVYDFNVYVDGVNYKDIFSFLGVVDEEIDSIFLWKNDNTFFRYYHLENFVLVSPFSNSNLRNIDLSRWVDLIEILVKDYKKSIVLLGNNFQKLKALYLSLSQKAKDATFVVSDASLYEVIFLIERSSYVLSVDTSIPHISSLLRKNTIVLVKSFTYGIHQVYNKLNVYYVSLDGFEGKYETIFEVLRYFNG